MTTLARPEPTEYAPHYGVYISQVPEGDILDLLEHQLADTLALLSGMSEERSRYRYAPGKWSIREVVGHVADSERVLTYRALRFARGDRTPLPSFDENAYVANANFDERPLADLVAELEAVRRATVAFFRGLPTEAFERRGTASGYENSVRGLLYAIAGHERHHARILRERYL